MSDKKPVIIIVDDEPMITETIATYLSLTTNYTVKCYNDPVKAVEDLKTYEFDLVISDFLMPVMNGLDFLSAVKAFSPQSVMIMLTGYADKENAIRAINELELYQYIEKPWENDKLSIIIRNGLERKNLVHELSNKVDELEVSHEKIFAQHKEIQKLYEMLKDDYQAELENVENVIVALAKAIEAKDKYTEGHTDRVSSISVKIGEKLGLSKEQIKILKIGGIVHDIGKIGIPESILNKPGKLDLEEFLCIKSHPVLGEEICRPLTSLQPVLPLIRQHHERLNGKGYPDGITSDKITLESKIIAVADVFDAISSDRPYRPAMSPKDIEFIMTSEKEAGNLDKEIVDILLALYHGNLL